MTRVSTVVVCFMLMMCFLTQQGYAIGSGNFNGGGKRGRTSGQGRSIGGIVRTTWTNRGLGKREKDVSRSV